MEFVEKLGGYIADVPKVDFTRCDGRNFHFDEVTSFNLSYNNETLTITGGWSGFPLAYIDTTKTLEASMGIANVPLEMFEMAYATNAANGDYGIRETERFEVETGPKITIPYEVKANSVKITGLEETTESTAATSKFKVAITAATASTDGSATVTFASGDVTVGDTVRVSFIRRMVNSERVSIATNGTSAKGELFAHWPVYSSGDDCTEASEKGRLHLDIYRVRATAMPGLDTSYKSAASPSVTFGGMDPKRSDGLMWNLYYEPFDADGKIVKKSAASEVNW